MDKFRGYLLHSNKAEGLEFPIKAGLWGHALFMASKMEQRIYAGFPMASLSMNHYRLCTSSCVLRCPQL